jgi:phage-related minor tail protein
MADIDVSANLDSSGFDRGVDNIQASALKASKALKDFKQANDDAAESQGKVARAASAATQQVNDFITQIIGGQNPLIAAFQQGQQLQGMFGSLSAGINEINSVLKNFTSITATIQYLSPAVSALASVFGTLVSVIFSTTGAVIAIVAAIGYLAYKVYDGIKAFDNLNTSLILTGQSAIKTKAEYENLTDSLTKWMGMSDNGRTVFDQMVSGGVLATSMLREQAKAIKLLADTEEQEKAIAENRIKANQDAVGFLNSVGKATGYVTAETVKNVSELQKQGKFIEAGAMAFNAYELSLLQSKKALLEHQVAQEKAFRRLDVIDFSSSSRDELKKVEAAIKDLEKSTDSLSDKERAAIAQRNAAIQSLFAYKNAILETTTAIQTRQLGVEASIAVAASKGDEVARSKLQTQKNILDIEKQIAEVKGRTDGNVAGNQMELDFLENKKRMVQSVGDLEASVAARNLSVQFLAMRQQTNALGFQLKMAEDLKRVQIETMGADKSYADEKLQRTKLEVDYLMRMAELDNKIQQEKAKGTIASAEQAKQYEKQQEILKANHQETRKLLTAELERARILEHESILMRSHTEAWKNLGGAVFEGAKLDLLSKAQTQSIGYAMRAVDIQKQFTDEVSTGAARLQSLAKINGGDSGYNEVGSLLSKLIEARAEMAALDTSTQDGIQKSIIKLDEVEKIQNRIAVIIGEKNKVEVDGILLSMSLEAEKAKKKIEYLSKEQDAIKARNASAAEGAKSAFDTITNSITPFSVASDAVTRTWNNIGNAFDNMIDKGKLDFGSLADSIIKDLLKIEMRAATMDLWRAMKTGSSGSSSGSAMKTIFSGLGFADGGQPPVGKASIVGENGPELFIPNSAGTIVPNNQLGGGGQQVVNHYYTTNNNISAVDGQSVARLFAENRKTLLGATEQARKELPVRMRA